MDLGAFLRRKLYVCVLAFGVVCTLLTLGTKPAQAASGINQQINFQGRLLNSQGATVPDGNYNIEFKVYQDGDGQSVGDTTGSPAGSLKWTEDYLNVNSQGVTVKNGYLSVQLGSVNPFGSSINWNSNTLWLSMNIASTNASCASFSVCTPDGEMTPMKRMSANAYALNSSLLNGLGSSQFVQIAQGVQTDASSATNSIFINKTGTGNLLDLQSSGSDAFVVANSGDATFGSNANHTLSVATAAANAAGNSLTVAAGAAGSGAASLSGGNLVFQAGAGGGTNSAGGNITIDAGTKTGSGSEGTISIGATTGSAITLGKATTLTTVNGRLAVGADYGATNNVTASSASTKATVTRGAASQTADLAQNQDANGAVLSGTNANGAAYSNGTGETVGNLAVPVITSVVATGSGGSLTNGTTYYYAVTATNAAGETIASTPVSFAATATGKSLVTWGQVAGATGYKIYRNTTNSFTSGTLLLTTVANGTTVTYTDTGSATAGTFPPSAVTGSKLTVQAWANQANSNVLEVDNSSGAPLFVVNGFGAASAVNMSTSQIQLSNGYLFNSSSASSGVEAKVAIAATTINVGDAVYVSTTSSPSSVIGQLQISQEATVRDPRVYGVANLAAVASGTSTVVTAGYAVVNADTGAVAIGDQLVTTAAAGVVTVDNTATTGIVGRALSTKTAGASGQVAVYVHTVSGQNSSRFQNVASATTPTMLLQAASSQTGDLLDVADASGNVNANFNTPGNQLTLGRIAASGTVTQGKLVVSDGTTDNFGLTVQSATLSSAQTITLPNATGTVALTSDTTNFIRNQASSQTGNFNITGTGIAGTLQSNTFDTSAAAALSIGGTNATSISVGSTTLSSGTQAVNIGTNNTAGSTTNVTIGAGATATGGTTTIQAKGNITLATNGVTRGTFDTSNNLYLGNGVTAAAPNNFAISGTASSTTAVAGGAITIQGGNATVGNANGGNITITGGNGIGTGVNGLVVLTTPTFSTTTNDANCYTGGAMVAVSCTIAANSVNNSAAIVVGFSAAGKSATLPNPTTTTAGRIVYITAANGSNDFSLVVNGGGTGNTIAMRQNTSATMIWNGSSWTAAGASSSTTLQSAYDNTLQSAGGAELIVSKTSNTNGLTIRDSTVNPVNSTLLSVQTSSAAVLLSVNSNVTEYSSDSGAETAGGTTNTFPASTWSNVGSASVSRYTTAGNYIATGQASTGVTTTALANDGVKNTLVSALVANTHYNVSFSARLLSGTFTDMNVYYSIDGTTASTVCSASQAVPTSVWAKVNCTFTAPASGITTSNAILIRQTSATARSFYIDNLSVTIAADYNYATDGGVDDSTNFATNWTTVSGATVTRSTTAGNDASDSAQVVTTGTGQGVRNKLSINPLPNTLYRITAYVASTTTGFNSFTVNYSRDGGTSFAACADYNTQAISSSVSAFTQVTCYITTDGTAATNPYVYFTQTDATGRTFYVDTFSMTLSTKTTPNVQIGGGTTGGPVTLLTLDRGASAPIASNNDALLGSMYYDTTLGKLQCYESDGWGACGSSPDNIVTISPEYTNAVMHGTGVGTMNSDICSGTLHLNDGTSGQSTICGTNETYNFYKWTSPQASAQTYSIYVTYQLPTTFKSFASGQTSIMGRTDSANSTVQYTVYRNDPTSGLSACGSAVPVSTGSVTSWKVGSATGAADPSTCGFAPGNSIVFKIDVTASQNANAYVGNLNFTFSNK